MDKVFKNERNRFVCPYLDDIVVFSNNIEEHENHLRIVFNKLKAANIKLNKKKCKLFRDSIKILGHLVSNGKVMTDPSRVEAISKFPMPEKVKELISFLGMAGFCRQFVPNFSDFVGPLENILKGEAKRSVKIISWSADQIKAFIDLRNLIQKNTERYIPDFIKEFTLITDASSITIGALLTQTDEFGRSRFISAFSKGLDSAQKNYTVTEKELLAIVKACEHFKHYLIGKKFVLKTDHKALVYLKSCKNPTSRLLRWALKLEEFDFSMVYIKVKKTSQTV
jgi:hypothetical protein